jgi:hypothetical protein
MVFVVVPVLSALVAALMPVSRPKGRIRLLESCLLGVAFLLASLAEILHEEKFWPQALVARAGIFLISVF